MTKLIETGVKAVDLFAPLPRGGQLAIGGEPGTGQVVLAFEITRNVTSHGGMSARYRVGGDVEEFRRALREAGVEADAELGDDGTRCELIENGEVAATLVVGADAAADSYVVLSRELLKQGQLPAVDPASSGSRVELGEHGQLAADARAAVAEQSLKGTMVRAFLRQWFSVSEPWTAQPGEYFSLESTLAGVRQMLRPA